MIFHRKQRKIDINNPSLNNSVLQRVNYTNFLGVTMTLFRSHGRDACPISLWESYICGELVSHVTFGFAGPETWPTVSCGLEAILACQGVSRASLQVQSSRKVVVRPLLMEPGSRQRHS